MNKANASAGHSGRPNQAGGNARVPANPRRVRGGIRLRAQDEQATPHWVTLRLRRLAERASSVEALAEGLEYARLGQARRLEIEPGAAVASVQGRASRPYTVTIGFEKFGAEDRDRILQAMADQAVYAAKLLADEVPANIEDVFAPLDLKLYPADPEDVSPSCTCREPTKPWCKHVVCAMALLAFRLGREPLLIFDLRGQPASSFMAMLRDRRALTSQGPGPAIVYQPQVPGVTDRQAKPLEAEVDHFWEAGPSVEAVDAPMNPPEVSHVLLRRLGQSPFPESRFPLVGLLATCYELISEHARREAEEPDSER